MKWRQAESQRNEEQGFHFFSFPSLPLPASSIQHGAPCQGIFYLASHKLVNITFCLAILCHYPQRFTVRNDSETEMVWEVLGLLSQKLKLWIIHRKVPFYTNYLSLDKRLQRWPLIWIPFYPNYFTSDETYQSWTFKVILVPYRRTIQNLEPLLAIILSIRHSEDFCDWFL